MLQIGSRGGASQFHSAPDTPLFSTHRLGEESREWAPCVYVRVATVTGTHRVNSDSTDYSGRDANSVSKKHCPHDRPCRLLTEINPSRHTAGHPIDYQTNTTYVGPVTGLNTAPAGRSGLTEAARGSLAQSPRPAPALPAGLRLLLAGGVRPAAAPARFQAKPGHCCACRAPGPGRPRRSSARSPPTASGTCRPLSQWGRGLSGPDRAPAGRTGQLCWPVPLAAVPTR
jgi:hypothetical protein